MSDDMKERRSYDSLHERLDVMDGRLEKMESVLFPHVEKEDKLEPKLEKHFEVLDQLVSSGLLDLALGAQALGKGINTLQMVLKPLAVIIVSLASIWAAFSSEAHHLYEQFIKWLAK